MNPPVQMQLDNLFAVVAMLSERIRALENERPKQ